MGIFSAEEIESFRSNLHRFSENGDAQAYEHLKEMLCQPKVIESLTHVLSRGCSDIPREDRGDIVQETLLRAMDEKGLLRLWEDYGQAVDPEIWLRTKLRGKVSDYLRGRKQEVPLGEFEEQGSGFSHLPAPPGLSEDERNQLWQAIRQCLNDMDFQIVWLRMNESLSWQQVAELLCISEENVRRRFSYACTQLQHCDSLVRFRKQTGLL